MPLTNISDIEKALKLEEGTLSNAISSEEEVKIELPQNLIIRTAEEVETRENNLKKEQKQAGIEIAVKNARNELGLEFEGKTIENLLNAYAEKKINDAKIDPNKKVEALTQDMEKLRANLKAKEDEVNNLTQTMNSFKNQTIIDSEINKAFSKVTEGVKTTLPIDDLKDLFVLRNKIELNDGKPVITKDGQPLKDQTTLEPLGIVNIASEFIKSYVTVDDGKGGGDTGGTPSKGSYESFENEMSSSGVRVGSEQFNNEMTKRINDGTLEV